MSLTSSPGGRPAPRIVAGTASAALADAVAERLGTSAVHADVERFPDGELRPAVGELRGDDVYVLHATGPPVNDNLVELLLLLDGCRRAGATRVTAVVPYFGYARQDRRSTSGQAVGARVAADTLTAVGADRIVVVDPHTTALEAMFDVPVEIVTAVPLLADAVRGAVGSDAVVVAPDLGATKLAERFAAALDAPVVVVRKTRLSGSEVRADEVVGDVAGRSVVVVDDMISTGGTVAAAVDVVAGDGGSPRVTVVATHGLFTGPAPRRLRHPRISEIVVTDTVPPPPAETLPVRVLSVAALLADTIAHLHR